MTKPEPLIIPGLEWPTESSETDLSAVAAVLQFRGQRTLLPSGIPNLAISPGDHIALVDRDGGDHYLSVILDFVAAGISNTRFHEQVSLELTEGRHADDVAEQLRQRIAAPELPPSLLIKDWDMNSSDYEPEYFDVPGMLRAMDRERERTEDDPNSAFRCASEDCSLFIRWLTNPIEYLDYEPRLALDLEHVVSRPAVQLCTFRSENLQALEQERGVTQRSAMARILAGHTKLLLIEDGRVMTGMPALRHLQDEYSISSRSLWLARHRARQVVEGALRDYASRGTGDDSWSATAS